MEMKGGGVIDADITGYFDNIDHGKLREILDQRVRDGVLRGAIDKWLKAGVFEDGSIRYSARGTPRGGVVSPLLANIYLHEVLDTWFDETVRPRLAGRAFLVRYADDFLLAFERREDAERVFEVLPKRFAKYGLTIHPEKSHMVRFTRPRLESEGRGRGPSGAPPGTFDLLGFTHHWAKSRKGNWVVKRRTMAKRFRRGLQQLRECCQAHRHAPLGEQWRTLSQKLRGHFAYYGITGNYTSISRFHCFATKIAKRSLDRRSQRGYLPWDKFKRLLGRYPLPTARWLPLDHPVQRNLGPRSRKRECRTSGSVRGRGEQSPRSTSISRTGLPVNACDYEGHNVFPSRYRLRSPWRMTRKKNRERENSWPPWETPARSSATRLIWVKSGPQLAVDALLFHIA